MRVAVDVSPLEQSRAGTARYLRGLLGELDRAEGVSVQALRMRGRGRLAAAFRDAAWYPAVLPRAAQRLGADVLHCPTFRGPIQRSSLPLVVTVHDLAVLRHPDAFNRWTRAYSARLVPRVVRAATLLIAVSEFTKRELVELLGVRDSSVRVIPNAVADTFAPAGPAAEGEYVLTVGTLEPRKNLPRLIRAAQLAKLELRVVGAPGWRGVTAAGDGVRWLGEVPDAELAALYRGAQCLVYPSLYEGFGIPVLEALACGTPVVTSSGAAMEEVAGGAAVLVDPRDPEAIAGGIAEALARRAELRRLGPERAQRFAWREVAAATVEVYREVAG